jgi:hypothetical protein
VLVLVATETVYYGETKLEVPRMTCPSRESIPGILGGRQAFQKIAIRTAYVIAIWNLYMAASEHVAVAHGLIIPGAQAQM